MDNDRFTNPELEDRPLVFLQSVIEKKFEGDPLSWKAAEPEVILEKLKDTGNTLTPRLMAKVKILKYIQEHSVHDLLEDPMRVVYSAEVLNNEDSVFYDVDFIPHLTSMEMAYFVQQMRSFGGLSTPENAPQEFKKVCAFVLSEDGFYDAPAPFSFLSKQDLFPVYMHDEIPETDKKLQSDKQQGIDKYLQLMAKLNQ